MSEMSNGNGDELVDGGSPDDPLFERRVEPADLDNALEEGAHDAEVSGEGGLLSDREPSE